MNCEYITFDLYSFNRYLQLLNSASLISIYINNTFTEIRGHFSNDDSNILSIVLNDNSIFELYSAKVSEDIRSIFTINKSSLDVLTFLDIGSITFYIAEDYIKILIDSKIKVNITTDNLYTYDFLELHIENNETLMNTYDIDKNTFQCISSILTHREKSNIYFKIDNTVLSLQSGNNTEFILLEKVVNENASYKFKVNFDIFIEYLHTTLRNNSCIGNYKLLFSKDRPLIIYTKSILCRFYLFMAPFDI